MALTARDRVLVAVPMFHANAWGLPFAAPAVGAGLILPGRATDGASLARLIQQHEATVAVGVPTVWLGLLDHLDAVGGETPSLQRIIIGGSSCPDALLRRMESRLGVVVQTSWGMTELSPHGHACHRPYPIPAGRIASGRPAMGLDMLLTDAAGTPLPDQRNSRRSSQGAGRPSVVRHYYGAAADARHRCRRLVRHGRPRQSSTRAGTLTLAGRSKDLIKSGGEWINPVEIEDIIGADAGHRSGRRHRPFRSANGASVPCWWSNRRQGHAARGPCALTERSLKGRVADWWIPDRDGPGSRPCLWPSTGKIDKTRASRSCTAAA